MKLWYLILILFVNSALAFPIYNPNCGADHDGMSALVEKTAVMCTTDETGHMDCSDPRGPLKKIAKRFGKNGLKLDEIATIAASTLTVDCENGDHGDDAAATGTLYGNCHQFVTNIHVIADGHGNMPKRCHIFNMGQPHFNEYVEINPQTARPMRDDGDKDWRREIMAVRFPENIPGLKCVSLDPSGELIRTGNQLLFVSAVQERMKTKFNGPIASICYGRELNYTTTLNGDITNTLTHSDCASTQGASGGGLYKRNRDGYVYLKSINFGSMRKGDHQPYKLGVNDEAGLGLDFNVLEDLMKFEREGNVSK